MEIRHFTQKDEKEVVALWNECCPKDQITLSRFRMQALYDDNFDESLCWVALRNEKITGFVMATKRKFPYMERGMEPERGWINVLFVAPEVRNQGLGSELLMMAEQELYHRGANRITLGAYSPNYFFPGIDEENYSEAAKFFAKHLYQREECHYSMGMSLENYKVPESIQDKKEELLKKGYHFLRFDEQYSLELLEFLKNEFGGGWKRYALILMRNHTAQDNILIVLDSNHKICGVCMKAIDENQERFGPIGIGKAYRNEKIGSVLLHEMCRSMKESGCKRMYFMTTDEAGKRYYERNGLTLLRVYRTYEKKR